MSSNNCNFHGHSYFYTFIIQYIVLPYINVRRSTFLWYNFFKAFYNIQYLVMILYLVLNSIWERSKGLWFGYSFYVTFRVYLLNFYFYELLLLVLFFYVYVRAKKNVYINDYDINIIIFLYTYTYSKKNFPTDLTRCTVHYILLTYY